MSDAIKAGQGDLSEFKKYREQMTRKRGEGGLIQTGELPAMKTLAKKYKPPTRAQLDLIEAAAKIHEQPDAAERAFMVRQLVLCTLPHSDPGDVETWTRKTGNAALGIQPAFDFETGRKIGFPYGTIPRLLLFWITTEIQLRKNDPAITPEERRTLQLGRSLADFMRQIGLNPDNGSGRRSDARRLHDQMDRLFGSRISFQQTIQAADGSLGRRRLNMEVAPESELWWDPRRPGQGALWQSWIRLGEELAKALEDLPVPLDMRALRALKRSPLALDVYAWICYRAFVIVRKGQPPQFVPWEALQRQMGTDYSDPKDFKKKAQAALRKIRPLYPGLSIGPARGGFMVHATRLAVPPKPAGKLIGE